MRPDIGNIIRGDFVRITVKTTRYMKVIVNAYRIKVKFIVPRRQSNRNMYQSINYLEGINKLMIFRELLKCKKSKCFMKLNASIFPFLTNEDMSTNSIN